MISQFFRFTFFAIFTSFLSFSSNSWAMDLDEKGESSNKSLTRAKPKGRASKDENPVLYVIESHVKEGTQAQLQITYFYGKRVDSVPKIFENTIKPFPFSSGKVITLRRNHLKKPDDCPSEAIEVLLLTSTNEASFEENTPLGGEGVIDSKDNDPLGLFEGDKWKILPGKRIKLS